MASEQDDFTFPASMASAQDDFTFPATTTADSHPHFIGSSALWTVTRQNSEILSKGEHEQEEDQEKSNTSLIQELKPSSIDRKENTSNDDEEEKMDMLWEDLNEEFSRNSGKISQNTDVSSPGRPVQVSSIKAMKFSKPNGHALSGKKSSNILVFIKIVKRAFAIHNSRRSIKKRGKYF